MGQWDKYITISLTVPVMLMCEMLPIMRDRKSGSAVNVSSKASVSGTTVGVAYTAST